MMAFWILTLQGELRFSWFYESNCPPLIQEITSIGGLKSHSYMGHGYSQFQKSKSFRNHLLKIKTPLQISSAEIKVLSPRRWQSWPILIPILQIEKLRLRVVTSRAQVCQWCSFDPERAVQRSCAFLCLKSSQPERENMVSSRSRKVSSYFRH